MKKIINKLMLRLGYIPKRQAYPTFPPAPVPFFETSLPVKEIRSSVQLFPAEGPEVFESHRIKSQIRHAKESILSLAHDFIEETRYIDERLEREEVRFSLRVVQPEKSKSNE
ncbi:hypothetical protein ABDK00_016975 [Niabella insulamsoli]|uniref:hypothetical protein n=1 Tax=Niabella insulamsoli TaxID=3144874 RepID=UPI0031FDB9A9